MENGPTKAQLQDLEHPFENNGYICVNKMKVDHSKFCTRQAICCGDPIEAYYYNLSKRGKRWQDCD
eukprot:1780329-Ditylum_brightwellii.AAC.1